MIGVNARWDEGGQPYWEGEVEECINGRTVADGAYFGADVSSIVDRLIGERLADGGWNCERLAGSVRSSFASTINVLEGLLEYERATGVRANLKRLAGLARNICLSVTSSAVSARVSRQTSGFCASCIRTVGATTPCVRSTISAALRC
ncbi:hypothetical protein ACVJBD_002017 [Rhizobium mongolense]